MRREQAAYGAMDVSPHFYERGVVDAVGGMLSCGELDAIAARQIIDAHPYQHVFIFPPWAQIYTTDAERDHTFDHAVGVYQSTRNLYLHFGYAPIEVPADTPHNRVEFILDHI